MRKSLLFIVTLALLLSVRDCCIAEENAPEQGSPESTEEFSLDRMIEELNEPESQMEKSGRSSLDKALSLKLTASTVMDIENILNLAKKAIKEGLTPEDEKIARALMRTTLLQRALITAEILRSGRAESDREISIITKIGLDDLKQVLNTFEPDENENQFEGADVYWYIKASLLYYSEQDEKELVNAVNMAKKLNPDNDARMAQLLFIEASFKSIEPEKQLELLSQAYEKDSESEEIERAYIIALFRNDKVDEAAKLLLPKEEKDELDDPIFIIILSEYYRLHEQPKKALDLLNTIPRPASDSVPVLKIKLICALDLDDKKLVQDILLRILNEEPQNISIRMFRIRLLISDKQYEDALQEIKLAQFFDENSARLQMVKMEVLCLMDKKNFDDAKEAINTLLDNKDADLDALSAAAQVASVMKDVELMLQISQRILALDEQNEGVLTELPSLYIALGQLDKAVEAFENCIKLYPENSLVLNNYSWFLATITEDAYRDGKKALELALKAAEATEYKEAYILSTLAAAYAETGDFENAVKTIQKALEDETDEKMTEELNNELESYKQNKPIREKADNWFK